MSSALSRQMAINQSLENSNAEFRDEIARLGGSSEGIVTYSGCLSALKTISVGGGADYTFLPLFDAQAQATMGVVSNSRRIIFYPPTGRTLDDCYPFAATASVASGTRGFSMFSYLKDTTLDFTFENVRQYAVFATMCSAWTSTSGPLAAGHTYDQAMTTEPANNRYVMAANMYAGSSATTTGWSAIQAAQASIVWMLKK